MGFFPGAEAGKRWALVLNTDLFPLECLLIPQNSLPVFSPPPVGIALFVARSELPTLPEFPQAANPRTGLKRDLSPAAAAPPRAEPIGVCDHSQILFPAGGAGRAGNDSALAQSRRFQHLPAGSVPVFPFSCCFHAGPAQLRPMAFPADVQNPGKEAALEWEGKGRAGNIPEAREVPGGARAGRQQLEGKAGWDFPEGSAAPPDPSQLSRDHRSAAGWAWREGEKGTDPKKTRDVALQRGKSNPDKEFLVFQRRGNERGFKVIPSPIQPWIVVFPILIFPESSPPR